MSSVAQWPAEAANFPVTNPAIPTIIDASDMRRRVVEFDQGATQSADFTFIAPTGITGALTLKVFFCAATATALNVQWQALIEAITPGDAQNILTTENFDTVNIATAATVPGTAGFVGDQDIPLSNDDSIAAGDKVTVRVQLNITGTTAAGSFYLTDVELQDAA